MTVSTAGISIPGGSRRLQAAVELLSSMRFAISLLTLICIASVIGTVLKQHEPLNNYINQFGPFWSQVFGALNLYAVYSAWWFMLILAFLVTSTTLCIVRNTPKILVDLRQYKENVRVQSLKAFPHKADGAVVENPEQAATRMGQQLLARGWKVKLQSRSGVEGEGWMVAAKAGAANKIGYLAAHSAIVLVCIGGLLDGDLIVRAQTWFNDKTPYGGGGLIADVPAQHRLSDRNPTFRGNLLVSEGTRSGTAILSQPTGVLLQDLPFDVELKKFVVEYYSTGMPKLFASDILIHDRATGEVTAARTEVNHPVKYKGVEIFQSSFDDGGSLLQLKAVPINGVSKPFQVEARVGGSTALTNGDQQMALEITGLRVINVENFNRVAGAGTDVRKVDLRSSIEDRLGSAHKTATDKKLRNVGPSVTYKLRDSAGQAREYHNYMLPVELDGGRVFLLGMRETTGEPFRYLRIPVDDQDSMDGFVRLRAALADPQARQLAVDRYVGMAVDKQRPELKQALSVSAQRAIDLFAGVDPGIKPVDGPAGPVRAGGLQAVSGFMELNVPEAERERAGEVLLRILNGTLFELLQISRERAGLPGAERNDANAAFMTQVVLSLSDAFFYPAPMTFQMTDFQQVQASVFQVSRAPGKTVVYIGCLFLILGVFAMLYVRERRLWIWVSPGPNGTGSHATMALSSNRKMLDTDKDFQQLARHLLQTGPENQP